MKTEIGSEFWVGCTPLNGSGVSSLLPAGMDARYTLCGRTALELVLRDVLQCFSVRSAYLPSYCCHTMIEPFVTKGINVKFYDVYFTEDGIACDWNEENDCDLVFLMDYFGFCDGKTVQRAKKQKQKGKCLVYDATHAMFCMGMDYSEYDYVFGSFRKWFGVNGGFCAKKGHWKDFPQLMNNNAYVEKRNCAFIQKRQFMDGKLDDKSIFLQAFSEAEEALEKDYLGYGADIASVNVLQSINVDYIRQRRKENAQFAVAQIQAMNSALIISPYKMIKEKDCPLFIPLQIDPAFRAEVRQLLIQNRCYLPVHWPLSLLHKTNSISQAIYNTELSFVCDQRYDLEDMGRMISLLRSV